MNIKNDVIKSVDSIIIHHPYNVDANIMKYTKDIVNKHGVIEERKIKDQKVTLTGYTEKGIPFCITVTGNIIWSFEKGKSHR